MISRRLLRWLEAAALTALLLVPAGGAWAATHYPPGSNCYDCHAVSKAKMVVGTHLIKKSQKTVDLGITTSSPAIRCLFCHEKNAVTATYTTTRPMQGVMDHFDASSLSKHPADLQSGFTAGANLDCLDCHTGITLGVVSDGAGNARVHGRDASASVTKTVNTTLLGNPTAMTDAELSTKVCGNVACHGDTVTHAFGTNIARVKHAALNTKITVNDVAQASGGAGANASGQVYCTLCHGKHNSPDGQTLLTLKNTTGANGQAATSATVRLDECEVCHNEDENGGLTDNYTQYGHGKVGITCVTCHDTSHDVGGDHVFDAAPRLKPTLAEQPTPTSTFSGLPYYSDCKVCHGAHQAHNAEASATRAGCRDCHDQHGTVVADATAANDGMIRRTIQGEDTRLPIDATANNLWFVFGQTYGVCDNAACHASITTNLATNHNGGALTATTCATTQGCHKDHLSATAPGDFGAASCTDCHGNTTVGNVWPDGTAENGTAYPNRPGDHQQHIDAIAAAMGWTTVAEKNGSCNWCHPNPGAGGHDTNTVGSLASTADVHGDSQNTATSFLTISGAANGVATDTYNNAATANGKACSNVDCHYRVTTPVTGTVTANGDGWYQPAAVATCSNCHGNGLAGAALPNSHPDHVTAAGKAYPCSYCHPSGAYTTSHQTGAVNWSFAGLPAALDPAPARTELYSGAATGTTTVKFGTGTFGTCSATYCHGNFTGGTVVNAPTWGTATTGQCGTCHPGNGTGNLTVINDANHTDHLTSAYGPLFTNTGCTGNATTGCHTDSQLSTATHVNGTKDFANINTTVAAYSALGATAPAGAPDATSTDRCNRCHSTAVVTGQTLSGTVLAKTNWTTAGYTLPCLTCHGTAQPATRFANGTGVAAPAKETYWGTTGHGRPTASGTYPVTTNPAANYVEARCTVCHNDTAAHISGTLGDTNRFKPVTESPALAYTDANSEVCLDCHKVGQSVVGNLGKDATNEATVHSGGVNNKYNTLALAANAFPAYGNAAAYATDPGYQCRACHDPHGTQRLAMVLDTIDGRLGGTSNPKTLAAGVLISGTDTDLRDLDPTAAADDGVCDVCHRASGTITPHPDTAHAGNHNVGSTGTSCMACHDHKKSFQGSCANDTVGCHGNATTKGWWPDGATYPDRAGDHTQHIDAIAIARYGASPSVDQKNLTCDTCHPSPGSSGHDTNTAGSLASTADVHRDPQNAATTFKTISGAANGATATYNNGTAVGQKSCANVDCHYRVTTPSTGTAPNVGWYNAADVATCSNCHGSGTAGAALPNAHPQHVGNAANQKTYPCTYCHPSGAYTTSHQTGLVNWSFAGTLDPGGTRTETYNAAATGTKAVSYGAGTYQTCASVYCHIQTSPAWNATISTTQCTLCHQTGQTAAPNPSSGLHYGATAPVVTAKWHDNTLDATNGCAVCHTTTLAQTTHVDGTFNGNSTLAADRTALGLVFSTTNGYTQTADNVGSCIGTWVGGASCHGGGGEAGTWARRWDASIHYSATGDVRCAGCHGGLGANDWTFGTGAHNTTDNNVEHGYNWDTPQDALAEVIGNHSANTSSADKCEICHVYPDAPYVTTWGTGNHGNNLIDMNSTMGYSRTGTPTFSCSTNCHSDNTLHGMEGSGWTVNNVAGPALSCTSCHKAGKTGALGVSSTSTHVTRGRGASYSTFVSCEDCHPGGANTHKKNGVATVVAVPNNATVGINYTHTVDTGVNGFVLGGTATSGTTEAEICWNCHNNATYGNSGANAISEFGVNNQLATGSSPYNYGVLSTPNWTTATWSSSRTQFAYKTGAIQSTHTANPSVTDVALGGANYSRTETPNAVADIRCSYCHDVHEMAQAPGDTAAGKPYLRGTWRGNPYEEDGAPRSGYANTTYFSTAAEEFGQVPRGIVTPQKIGGYWIDQNNVTPMSATTAAAGTAALNPTSSWTVDQFAGLCALCHGGGNASWTATEVDGIDQRTGEGFWLGTNGHANSVKGGTGATSANSFNVFDARGGTATYSNNPLMHYNGMVDPADNGTWGFRSANSSALRYTPLLQGGNTRPQSYGQDRWVVDETGATKENQYHKFSCSKCHNPHASRLPKLMITNCLDTVHNTWDNQFQMVTASSTLNNNREIAQWTSAQNCHRYSESNNTTTTSPEYRANRQASPAGSGAGWNKVTPWKQTTNTP